MEVDAELLEVMLSAAKAVIYDFRDAKDDLEVLFPEDAMEQLQDAVRDYYRSIGEEWDHRDW